jgi:hypothetical protein
VRSAVPVATAAGGATPPRRPPDPNGGSTGPLPASPPAARPADRGKKKKAPVGVIVAVVVLLLAVAGGAVALASGGGGGDDGGGAVTTTGLAGANTKCTSASGRCARLTDVKLQNGTYVATYTVKGFEPIIYDANTRKGNPEDHHVHFFFDTVPTQQAGTPGQGPWTVWDRDSGRGQLRFDAFSVSNQAQQGGEGASKLCILVADAQHGVEQGSGNCLPLPKS